MLSRRSFAAASCCLVVLLVCVASAQQTKPNILVIMGEDIGWLNPSCYNSVQRIPFPRQKPASFNLDEVMRTMEEAGKAAN
jgi:hypothetical protein